MSSMSESSGFVKKETRKRVKRFKNSSKEFYVLIMSEKERSTAIWRSREF